MWRTRSCPRRAPVGADRVTWTRSSGTSQISVPCTTAAETWLTTAGDSSRRTTPRTARSCPATSSSSADRDPPAAPANPAAPVSPAAPAARRPRRHGTAVHPTADPHDRPRADGVADLGLAHPRGEQLRAPHGRRTGQKVHAPTLPRNTPADAPEPNPVDNSPQCGQPRPTGVPASHTGSDPVWDVGLRVGPGSGTGWEDSGGGEGIGEGSELVLRRRAGHQDADLGTAGQRRDPEGLAALGAVDLPGQAAPPARCRASSGGPSPRPAEPDSVARTPSTDPSVWTQAQEVRVGGDEARCTAVPPPSTGPRRSVELARPEPGTSGSPQREGRAAGVLGDPGPGRRRWRRRGVLGRAAGRERARPADREDQQGDRDEDQTGPDQVAHRRVAAAGLVHRLRAGLRDPAGHRRRLRPSGPGRTRGRGGRSPGRSGSRSESAAAAGSAAGETGAAGSGAAGFGPPGTRRAPRPPGAPRTAFPGQVVRSRVHRPRHGVGRSSLLPGAPRARIAGRLPVRRSPPGRGDVADEHAAREWRRIREPVRPPRRPPPS